MKIAVLANDQLFEELICTNDTIEWLKIDQWPTDDKEIQAAAYFNLGENTHQKDYSNFTQPVFISTVKTTLKEINAPKSVCNIMAWPEFLKRSCWEISGTVSQNHIDVLNTINKTYVAIADEPGWISARVISMIINEAYFALEEQVSTKEEIDIAMKLGTNYPYGPFEWSKIIGLGHIYHLLKKLSITDKRYTPSALLTTEATFSLCP